MQDYSEVRYNNTVEDARRYWLGLKMIRSYLEESLLHYCVEDLPKNLSHPASSIDIYDNYVSWCKVKAAPVSSKADFFHVFDEVGFKRAKINRRVRYLLDIELTDWRRL